LKYIKKRLVLSLWLLHREDYMQFPYPVEG